MAAAWDAKAASTALVSPAANAPPCSLPRPTRWGTPLMSPGSTRISDASYRSRAASENPEDSDGSKARLPMRAVPTVQWAHARSVETIALSAHTKGTRMQESLYIALAHPTPPDASPASRCR